MGAATGTTCPARRRWFLAARKRAIPEIITKRRIHKRLIVVPDTQCKPGNTFEHLTAVGNYIADKEPDWIAHMGDHWDFASLSTYEPKESIYWHDPTRTYEDDIDAGNAGMAALLGPIERKIKRSSWAPKRRFFVGNHEERVLRAGRMNPAMSKTYTFARLHLGFWEVVPFLKVEEIEGVLFSHYFVNQQSLKRNVLGGSIDNRLNKIKKSFVMGHQQGRWWGSQWTSDGRELMGLVVGSCYAHNEHYMPDYQGNHYWRGIAVLNELHEGRYDPTFVSLDYLTRNYL